jgi:hypothetical protein
MIYKILLFILSVLILANVVIAQNPHKQEADSEEPVVTSWKKGNDTFENQLYRFVLSSKNNNFEQEVVSKFGRRYKLFTQHNFYDDLSLEHWLVEFREILTEKKMKKVKLGNQLLTTQILTPGIDYYRKGDSIGLLYPEEKAIAFSSKGEPLYGGGYDFYFFKTVRKIKIENFCLIIKVGDYQFNKTNEKKLDVFEVFVEFNDTCNSSLISEIK